MRERSVDGNKHRARAVLIGRPICQQLYVLSFEGGRPGIYCKRWQPSRRERLTSFPWFERCAFVFFSPDGRNGAVLIEGGNPIFM